MSDCGHSHMAHGDKLKFTNGGRKWAAESLNSESQKVRYGRGKADEHGKIMQMTLF